MGSSAPAIIADHPPSYRVDHPPTVISSATKWSREISAPYKRLLAQPVGLRHARHLKNVWQASGRVVMMPPMSGPRQYFVYIMTNKSGMLYVGVTNNIRRRVQQHKEGSIPGFTSKYRIVHLVYVECFSDVMSAMAREKQIKKWGRGKKLSLIKSVNPIMEDLTEALD